MQKCQKGWKLQYHATCSLYVQLKKTIAIPVITRRLAAQMFDFLTDFWCKLAPHHGMCKNFYVYYGITEGYQLDEFLHGLDWSYSIYREILVVAWHNVC